MTRNIFAPLTLLVLTSLCGVHGVSAQVNLSGVAFIDYSYVLDDPAGEADGDNAFSYRRLYLTGDYGISDNVSLRARLEAKDPGTNEERSYPFVKDLYVRWKNAFAEGHELFIGISPTPIWQVSEKFLGYRSLEATLLDVWGIAKSRDFGVKAQGPLTGSGTVRYALMIGNNSSISQESPRHKRLYAQLEAFPSDRLSITIGGDYASMEDGSTVTANAFAGYRLERVRFGAEAFVSPFRSDDADPVAGPDRDRSGISVFAAATASPTVEIMARFDHFSRSIGDQTDSGAYGLVGAAFQVEDGFRIIPNIVFDRSVSEEDPFITGRVTVEAGF